MPKPSSLVYASIACTGHAISHITGFHTIIASSKQAFNFQAGASKDDIEEGKLTKDHYRNLSQTYSPRCVTAPENLAEASQQGKF